MTDKVQKIREEVERRKSLICNNSFLSDYEKGCNDGREDMCDELISIIDSLQKEPVKDRFAFKAIPRLLDMIEPTDRAKAYIAKLADTLEVEGYSTDAKIVRACLKRMNGEKVPMATMNEEPVSENLEYASEKYACRFSSSKYGHDKIKATFKVGAKWQLEQMKEILRTEYEKGRYDMREQMLSKAIDVEVKVDAGGYPYIPIIELYDYDKDVLLAKEGDKYKVILIKED